MGVIMDSKECYEGWCSTFCWIHHLIVSNNRLMSPCKMNLCCCVDTSLCISGPFILTCCMKKQCHRCTVIIFCLYVMTPYVSCHGMLPLCPQIDVLLWFVAFIPCQHRSIVVVCYLYAIPPWVYCCGLLPICHATMGLL